MLFTWFCFLVGSAHGSQQVGVEGGERTRERQDGPDSNRNVFLHVELYERSKSRPTHQVVRLPSLSHCAGHARRLRQVERAREKKKWGGGYECGRQKLKWLSVNVKNNNKENFFFFQLRKKMRDREE